MTQMTNSVQLKSIVNTVTTGKDLSCMARQMYMSLIKCKNEALKKNAKKMQSKASVVGVHTHSCKL